MRVERAMVCVCVYVRVWDGFGIWWEYTRGRRERIWWNEFFCNGFMPSDCSTKGFPQTTHQMFSIGSNSTLQKP
jgi:hypothetical protein